MTESMDEVLDALDASPDGDGIGDRLQVVLEKYAAAASCTFKVSKVTGPIAHCRMALTVQGRKRW